MADFRSDSEVHADYVDKMGPRLGGIFHEFSRELVWLHVKWTEYRELYGSSPSRVDLLNEAAPHFFGVVEGVLWEDVLLHLARLTDRCDIGGRENLTFRALAQLIEPVSFRDRVEALVNTAVTACGFARDWRNRRIAHRDLALALDEGAKPLADASRASVEAALKSFSDVLNCVHEEYMHSSLAFLPMSQFGGAGDLLYRLHDGVKAERERAARLERGEYTKEDLDQPRL